MAYFAASEVTFAEDGTKTILADGNPDQMDSNARMHVIAVKHDGTAGTITPTVKVRGSGVFENIYESDGTTQVVIDLADYKSLRIENYSFEDIQFVLEDFDGESCVVTVSSGD